jgi:hypothetical protein
VGPHVAEEVLLIPAAEHEMGDDSWILVVSGREDLGLVIGVGVSASDLATGESVLAPLIGDCHLTVGQQVVMLATGGGGVDGGTERTDRFARGGLLAVSEDVEAGQTQLLEQLG